MGSRNELTEFCSPNLQNRNLKSELHEMNSNMLQSQLICYNLLLKVHQIIPTSVLQKNKNFRYQAKAGKGKSVFPGRSAQQSFKREGTAQRSNSSKKKNIFDWKGSPFVYLLLTNGTPFTYLLWNFTSLLTGVKCGCLLNMNKSQNQKVFSTFSRP